MKTLTTLLFVFCIHVGYGQQNWMALTNTETRFAKYAAEHSIKEAFLKFMDTSAVVFEKGEIKKAKQLWESRPADKARLTWEPSFAIVASGNDLGVTSGPWQFKAEGKDSVIGTGEFTTVWMKKDTAWKWVVDIGIDHNQKIKSPTISGIEMRHAERSSYPGLRYMLMNEENFIKSYSTAGKDAYRDVADDNIYFVTQGFTPVNGVYRLDDALTNLSGTMQFQAVNSGCSVEGDVGYVYGYVTDKGKKGNYLRVWRRIGRKWTLLLQTLTI